MIKNFSRCLEFLVIACFVDILPNGEKKEEENSGGFWIKPCLIPGWRDAFWVILDWGEGI